MLPVIVNNEETMETYKKRCSAAYGTGIFGTEYQPDEKSITRINGAIELADAKYIVLMQLNGVNEFMVYGVKCAAGRMPLGATLADAYFDATSPFKVLK